MAVIYRYSRYFARGESTHDTFDEALDRAAHDLEYNEAYPIEIVAEDGSVLSSGDELHEKCFDIADSWKGR